MRDVRQVGKTGEKTPKQPPLTEATERRGHTSRGDREVWALGVELVSGGLWQCLYPLSHLAGHIIIIILEVKKERN